MNNLFFRGAPIILTIFAYVISIIGIGFPIISLIIYFNIYGKLIMILLSILLMVYILRKSIISVTFEEDYVLVVKPLRRKRVNYQEIDNIRENKEGFLSLTLIVFSLKDDSKFYLFCPQKSRSNLDYFLRSKNLKINKQL